MRKDRRKFANVYNWEDISGSCFGRMNPVTKQAFQKYQHNNKRRPSKYSYIVLIYLTSNRINKMNSRRGSPQVSHVKLLKEFRLSLVHKAQ